jgi:beta-1,4-mannosyl-glycoprotein beta-1,4-N-acetylglucosaminyltransferase
MFLTLLLVASASAAPLVIDSFTFNNEPMAFMRLDYLHDVVDFFLLAESNVTFQGTSQPFPSSLHPELLIPYKDKILITRVNFDGLDLTTNDAPWRRERHQRDSTGHRALELFQHSRFVLVLSDADEVPHRDNYVALRESYEVLEAGNVPVHLYTQLFYYSFDWLCLQKPPSVEHHVWKHSFAVTDSVLRSKIAEKPAGYADDFRWGPAKRTPLQGGWHCSSCMSAERLMEKARSFAHADFPKLSIEWTRYAMTHGLDVFNRTSDVHMEHNNGQYPPFVTGGKTLDEWITLLA